jgi:hypothetical protein
MVHILKIDSQHNIRFIYTNCKESFYNVPGALSGYPMEVPPGFSWISSPCSFTKTADF